MACSTAEKQSVLQRPNIVLIMGDDIGFSDIGCYGGEIPTPNLDKLATEGIRFRQFYNMAKCETTRSTMLTGLYQGDKRAMSIGNVLKQGGYTTLQFGKEHYRKWVPQRCFAKNAMDHSLVYWTINEYFLPPSGQYAHPFELDGKALKPEEIEHQQEPLYKTDFVTDYALQYLDRAIKKDAPFFLYLPYNSAHYPLQARPEDIAKFRGKYKTGWDSLRAARYAKMVRLGVLDPKYQLSPPEGNINKFRGHPAGDEERRAKIPLYRPWNTLSDQEKNELDLEMSVFAAMVHRLDYNIGRVVDFLEKHDLMQNTLIMYLSDNGSCPYDSNRDFDHPPGGADSYRTLCAAWANLGNTPFRYFKQYGHEGGCHTQLIVHWPEMIKNKGEFTDQPGHVVDIFPTLLDVAHLQYPDSIDSQQTIPLEGESLLPIFKGEQRPVPAYFVSGVNDRFRMYREGDWKMVKVNNENWQLYNMKTDLTELHDLAGQMPEKMKILTTHYETWENNHVFDETSKE